MSFRLSRKKYNIWFFVLFLCFCKDAFPENPYKSGEVRADHPKGCAYLRCNRGDQCVSRKFWCKNPPCPSMLYCSKSRKESLKGPASCEAVRCSKGFICLVRVRHCRWGEGCEQQIARCVSERDYYEGPASCADFRCPTGNRCILRESLCARPPCKLLKSCANARDANIWLEGCKSLGCLSEHECFLRRPSQDCTNSPCKHTPDCSAKSEGELEIGEQCRGWVCPKGQECSTHTKGPCKHEGCRISRSCHKPLILPFNASRLPQHSWRDDIRLGFYSKEGQKNSFTPGINRSSSVSTTDKITRVNGAPLNKKYPINLENGKFREIYGVPPNSRPFSGTPDVTSDPVIKPSVTSLTAWLNHLKLVTGVEAIEIWVKRSDKQDNYEDFLEWLESVKDMLGTAAYDLWLEEVRAMTVTSPAFQKWLPPPNRSANKSGDDLDKKKNIFLAKSETPLGKSILKDNFIGNVPGLSPTLPTIGINDWSRLQSASPNFQQAYQSFQTNFGNSGPWTNPAIFYQGFENTQQVEKPNFGNFRLWSNPAVPYPGFENVGLLNPSDQQFHANWSYQQPFVDNPPFLLPNMWQNEFIPPLYPQWQQPRDYFEIFPIPQIPELPDAIVGSMGEEPMNFYSQNSTDNYGSAWGKYFLEPYVTSQFVPPVDFGAYPENVRNFGYPNWRGSSYGQASLGDLPHHRLKQDSSQDDIGNSRYNERYENEKLSGPSLDSSFYYRDYPGDFPERRMPGYHLHRRDYNVLNLDEKKNHDHSVNVDPELKPPNRDFADNGYPKVYKPEYHWTDSYSHDQLYKNDRTPPSSLTTTVPFSPIETNDEVTQKIFTGDRINDVPGQAMEFPDLWNSRYRNPSNAILRAIAKEEFANRDAMTMSRPTSTTSTTSSTTPNPTPSTTKITAPLPSKVSNSKDTANYNNHQSEEDDGIYPLLLSLQGYIESPLTQVFPNFARSIKNTSILPVYTINGDVRTNDDYDDYYEPQDENPGLARSRNQEPGIDERYSKLLNFKTIFGIEIPRTRQNLTDSDIAIKNGKWEYEDDVDENIRDPPNFWLRMQTPIPSTDDSSNVNPIRDWVVDSSGLRNEGKIESDYYDERIDYADDAVPGGAMYFDPEKINDDDSLDHDETPDDLNDSFYQDSDHKRVKKNRPL